ncbi:MAG: ion transporter, partial [Spirochaetaceae bacterium]|nr:ion transporter [Spirochaetaceae bacterium]
MKGRFRNLIEGLVTTAIILVLIQTIAEDVLVMSGASWMVRRIFLYTGFAFDLFFTVEFLIRSWDAMTRRSYGRYIFRENGWVDFVASVPLLIFTSGPEVLALST